MPRLPYAAGLLTVLLVLGPTPASAQWPVIDVTNLIETVRIAKNTWETYQTLRDQYATIERMAKRLPDMEKYRTPDIPFASHDVSRATYARPWLQALNAGDPSGSAYFRVVRSTERPEDVLPALAPDARRNLERAYATLDVADSTAFMGAHQVGAIRGHGGQVAASIRRIEADTLGGPDRYHQQTAILDKLIAAEIIARRQDTATNQLISHLLEQLLVDNKRARDAEAVLMDMRINNLRHYEDYSRSFWSVSSHEEMRAWRQP
ncbi:MAG: hypothetical protein ACRD2X_07755 [Vicinamibacteraceae bacterium]